MKPGLLPAKRQSMPRIKAPVVKSNGSRGAKRIFAALWYYYSCSQALRCWMWEILGCVVGYCCAWILCCVLFRGRRWFCEVNSAPRVCGVGISHELWLFTAYWCVCCADVSRPWWSHDARVYNKIKRSEEQQRVSRTLKNKGDCTLVDYVSRWMCL